MSDAPKRAAMHVAMLSPVTPAHGRGGVQDIVWSLARGLVAAGCDCIEGWWQRMVDILDGARALEPRPIVPSAPRAAGIAAAYDAVFRSRTLADRYRARFVVVRRAAGPPPPWLEPVASNLTYALYRVCERSGE